ncbi:MAG: DNA mismatch repair endonuclease MutL, partial [Clostridia bacterium]|nr:DNA mismatch repair endonuclease MutL [Clostridia bacterium]
MGIIQKLDDLTISQIAAGEIIERPASVIRELCDNAVDAGATAVSISIEQGGLLSITVADDGCGMAPEDAARAFERHATSKLRHARQLATVETMGFRGEALAAVASVAQVTMHTRLTTQKDGVCVEVQGGGQPKTTPAGCAAGTRIAVRNLFYNAPARRAF